MAKYGCLSLYDIDIEEIYAIDDEDIYFVNKYESSLIGNPDHIDGTSTDHEYFLIHDDLFDRILSSNHNTDMTLKFIPKDALLTSINDSSIYSISNLRKRSEIVSPRHIPKRKRHKTVN